MSLFIDALAKQIISHMKYKEDEIEKLKMEYNILKTQIDRGAHICDPRHDEDGLFQCYTCLYGVCDDCAIENKWIHTKYCTDCDCSDCEGYDLVIECNDEHRFDAHHSFCSQYCFTKYYGRGPIVGQTYTNLI